MATEMVRGMERQWDVDHKSALFEVMAADDVDPLVGEDGRTLFEQEDIPGLADDEDDVDMDEDTAFNPPEKGDEKGDPKGDAWAVQSQS